MTPVLSRWKRADPGSGRSVGDRRALRRTRDIAPPLSSGAKLPNSGTLNGSRVHSNLFFTGQLLARPPNSVAVADFLTVQFVYCAPECDRRRKGGLFEMSTAAIRRLAAMPSPEELIGRAREMVPEIRTLAEETERNRNLFPHIIGKIRDAELLRTCRPKEFGGFEYDPVVALEIALAVSAACASTGWGLNGALSHRILFGHYPSETQRELWGGGDDPFTCACFAPTGEAVPREGGYVLSGKWSFASGCDHSSWKRPGPLITPPGGAPPHEGAFFLLPIGDVEIEDNWFVCGLSGTGSKNIIAHEVFVPQHRVLLFADTRSGRTQGARHHKNPLYRLPLLVVGATMLASTAVGAAKGALEAYLGMTTGRETRGALAGGGLAMAQFA